MSTGQGFAHLWQMVQWSATSSSQRRSSNFVERSRCASYSSASMSAPMARFLLRGWKNIPRAGW